jgi:hypothetical protein
MDKIFSLIEISDTGENFPPDWVVHNVGKNFRGTQKIIGFDWQFDGKKYHKRYAHPVSPQLLPDGSGILVAERLQEGSYCNELVLYEPDGGERFRVRPPLVTERSRPEQAHYYVSSYWPGEGWIVEFTDGDNDYRGELDIHTGQIDKFKVIRY